MLPGRTFYHRPATASLLVTALLSILVMFGLFIAAICLRPDARHSISSKTTVRVYCASGVATPLKKALVELRSREKDLDVRIVRTAGSGRLLGQVTAEYQSEVARAADLLVTADVLSLNDSMRNGIFAAHYPLAKQAPVIAVPATSGGSFENLSEMVAADGIRFGVANQRAAIGAATLEIARAEGVAAEVVAARRMEAENVMQLAQALHSGNLDAAILWDATVRQMNRQSGSKVLKTVTKLQSLNPECGMIGVGIVASSPNRSAATRVAEFLASPHGGKAFLQDAGFAPVSELGN